MTFACQQRGRRSQTNAFGMKVILNLNSPTYSNVYGILVPTRYVAWFELVLAQTFVPGVSFFSHVCGILAGVLYIRYSHLFTIDALTTLIGQSASMVGCALKRCLRLLCAFIQSRNNHLAQIRVYQCTRRCQHVAYINRIRID